MNEEHYLRNEWLEYTWVSSRCIRLTNLFFVSMFSSIRMSKRFHARIRPSLIIFDMVLTYDGLQRFYNFLGTLIGLLLNYARDVIIHRIYVWRVMRPYVWDDAIVKIVIHSFLDYFGLIKRHTLCIQGHTNVSNTSLYPATLTLKLVGNKWEGIIFPSMLMTTRTIIVVGNGVHDGWGNVVRVSA